MNIEDRVAISRVESLVANKRQICVVMRSVTSFEVMLKAGKRYNAVTDMDKHLRPSALPHALAD